MGFLLAATLPWVVFHRAIGLVAESFRLDPSYLTGWAPWLLIALGLAFFVPVVFSIGRDPEGRFYPRARNAYAGWGVSLYLLGLVLATQVNQLTNTAVR